MIPSTSRVSITSIEENFPNLRNVLDGPFERTGAIEDLNRATPQKEGDNIMQTDHTDGANNLNNLGSALQRRFQQTGASRK